MMISDEKEYYIEAKHWTYTDYTIRARSKEHAIEHLKRVLGSHGIRLRVV